MVLKGLFAVGLTTVGAPFSLNRCTLLAAPAVEEAGPAVGSTGGDVSGLLDEG
jgi:hypothetical protein